MTELEKIAYAKSFIDKLAQGVNPIDDTQIPEGDVVNNVRLSRCFFYVSDILRQVIDNGGTSPAKSTKKHKQKFVLSNEEYAKIEVSNTSMSISEIANYLNSLVDENSKKKISGSVINTWLVEIGLLENSKQPDGKNKRIPTELGKDMGIHTESRTGRYGEYTVVLYNADAQEFIYDNIEAIAESKYRRSNPEFKGTTWTSEQDELLVDLFNKKVSIPEIASTLKRSRGGVRARLKRFGLMNEDSNKDSESTLVQLRKENTVEVPKERTVSIINGKIYTSDMNGYDDVCNQALNTTNTVEISVHTQIEENKKIKSCSDCYHNRSGECSSWEVCDDFRPAINLSKTDTDYWPTEGDATFIKQKGHKRYD